jgi:hypothetical protein
MKINCTRNDERYKEKQEKEEEVEETSVKRRREQVNDTVIQSRMYE